MLYTSHMTYNVTQDRLLHILQWKGEESHRLDIRWYLIPQLTQTVMAIYFPEARQGTTLRKVRQLVTNINFIYTLYNFLPKLI